MTRFLVLWIVSTAMAVMTMAPVNAVADNAGVLTLVAGPVELYSNPGKSVQGPPPHVLFEGDYYSVRKARMGDKIEQGNILKTGGTGKARIVYLNGDNFNVGSNTAYKITWKDDKKAGGTNINLIYGKIRSVVSKDGPRNKMNIKTPTAVAGVRGTDFFVESGGPSAGTKLSVMRGEVSVKAAPAANAATGAAAPPEAKPTLVKSGYVVDVQSAPQQVAKGADAVKTEVPKIELRKTTQEELVAIQQVSQIKAPAMVASIEPEQQKQLADLEKKAVETTMNDIKTGDPKLYEQIKDKKPENINEINSASVANVYKEAPKAPNSLKPGDLKDLDEDIYKKYFNPQ